MKLAWSFLLAGAAPLMAASLLDGAEPLTLEAAEMARVWQEVSQGVREESVSRQDAWYSAMLEVDAELARVLLLAWLQQQNPHTPLLEAARDYAEALQLHFNARNGLAEACVRLAACYRAGQLGKLALPASEAKARWFEQRALSEENLPK